MPNLKSKPSMAIVATKDGMAHGKIIQKMPLGPQQWYLLEGANGSRRWVEVLR